MRSLVTRFLKDESGANAIKCGLIAPLIAVAIIGVRGCLARGSAARSTTSATP